MTAKLSILIGLLLVLCLISGCSKEKVAEPGDLVTINYVGKLDDGTVFDSSEGKDPLVVNLGGGEVIPGFENGIIGMKVGEKKTITIPPDSAYGPVRQELIGNIPKEFLAGQEDSLKVGGILRSQSPDGRMMQATILEITDDSVKIDANHMLAGKTLTFDIEVVSISKGTE